MAVCQQQALDSPLVGALVLVSSSPFMYYLYANGFRTQQVKIMQQYQSFCVEGRYGQSLMNVFPGWGGGDAPLP